VLNFSYLNHNMHEEPYFSYHNSLAVGR
jgi:hypothetical protein